MEFSFVLPVEKHEPLAKALEALPDKHVTFKDSVRRSIRATNSDGTVIDFEATGDGRCMAVVIYNPDPIKFDENYLTTKAQAKIDELLGAKPVKEPAKEEPKPKA